MNLHLADDKPSKINYKLRSLSYDTPNQTNGKACRLRIL